MSVKKRTTKFKVVSAPLSGSNAIFSLKSSTLHVKWWWVPVALSFIYDHCHPFKLVDLNVAVEKPVARVVRYEVDYDGLFAQLGIVHFRFSHPSLPHDSSAHRMSLVCAVIKPDSLYCG